MYNTQSGYQIKFEYGLEGIKTLFDFTDIFIIVDILSFSTCVEIATSNDAKVYPFQWANEKAQEYSKEIDAILASKRNSADSFSLSQSSLLKIPKGFKIVLPSPNGSTLSLETNNKLTIAGCLRNAKAVAEYANKYGKNITVIASGEKWENNNTRFAVEDLIGAGAIISELKGSLSPEGEIAKIVFENKKENLLQTLKNCSSGQELILKGFESDIDLSAQLNISSCVPVLHEQRYYEKIII